MVVAAAVSAPNSRFPFPIHQSLTGANLFRRLVQPRDVFTANRPFKIRLSKSDIWVGAHGLRSDSYQIIVEFPLAPNVYASQISRRSRIFASLVELGPKQRTSISRIATEAAKAFNEAAIPAVVRFGLQNQYGKSFAEVQVAATEPDSPQGILADRLAYLHDLAAPLRCKAHALTGDREKCLSAGMNSYSHNEAHELSYSLELMGKQSELDDAAATLKRLELLVTKFVQAIEAYASSAPTR